MNKLLKLLLIGILLLLLLNWYIGQVRTKSDNAFNRGLVKKVLEFDKVSRECYISGSAGRLKGKNAPMFIFLHGMDGAWPNRRFTKPQYESINKIAWDNDIIAVFPQGTQGACHDPEKDPKNEFLFYSCWDTKTEKDRSFLKKLIEAMVKQYEADPQKIYLTGFSNGGYFVSDYLISHNDNLFAGYGIHAAGGTNFNNSKTDFSKLKVSLNVGIKDKFQREEMKSLKDFLLKKGMTEDKNLRYFEYNASHEMSRNAIDSEIKFFLKKD